jgi:hypothetical protein
MKSRGVTQGEGGSNQGRGERPERGGNGGGREGLRGEWGV